MSLSKKSYFKQFLTLMLLLLLFAILGTIITLIIALFFCNFQIDEISKAFANANYLRFSQIIQSIFIFIIPSLLFAKIYYKSIATKELSFKKVPLLTYTYIIAIILSSLLIISALGIWNNNLVFPEWMDGISRWMRETEIKNNKLIDSLINTKNIGYSIINVFIIAILPAVSEEIFFRGTLQKLFSGWFKNYHISIFVTAIIFSAIHMQFFTFMPRFVLGLLFGYFMVYTGSLWPSIVAHFTNNFIAFLSYQYYLYTPGEKNPITEVENTYPESHYVLLSLTSAVILYVLFYKYTRKWKKL